MLDDLLPKPEIALKRQRGEARTFMRCPHGHDLPHRLPWGRCSPVYCLDWGQNGTVSHGKGGAHNPEADRQSDLNQNTRPYRDEMALLPLGMEARAMTHDHSQGIVEAEAAQFMAEFRREALRSYAERMARAAIHPMPEIPDPPDLAKLGPEEYTRQRIKQVLPYMIEAEVYEAMYGKAIGRSITVKSILARGGFPDKGDNLGVSTGHTGPVIQVNVTVNPYEKQKEMYGASVTINGKDKA